MARPPPVPGESPMPIPGKREPERNESTAAGAVTVRQPEFDQTKYNPPFHEKPLLGIHEVPCIGSRWSIHRRFPGGLMNREGNIPVVDLVFWLFSHQN